jgi:hypothetical protein
MSTTPNIIYYAEYARCRGPEVRYSTVDRWVMGSNPDLCMGMPVITHRSCLDDWLARFSLTIVHRGGLKQYLISFLCRIHPIDSIDKNFYKYSHWVVFLLCPITLALIFLKLKLILNQFC